MSTPTGEELGGGGDEPINTERIEIIISNLKDEDFDRQWNEIVNPGSGSTTRQLVREFLRALLAGLEPAAANVPPSIPRTIPPVSSPITPHTLPPQQPRTLASRMTALEGLVDLQISSVNRWAHDFGAEMHELKLAVESDYQPALEQWQKKSEEQAEQSQKRNEEEMEQIRALVFAQNFQREQIAEFRGQQNALRSMVMGMLFAFMAVGVARLAYKA